VVWFGSYADLVIVWREAIRDSDSLSANARLVAHTLGTYMHVDGSQAYPSLDTLAHGCKRGRKRVIAGIAELEQAGYLDVVRGGGRGRPNVYAARFPDDDVRPEFAEPSRSETATVSFEEPNDFLCMPQTGSDWLRELERNKKEIDAEVDETVGRYDWEPAAKAEGYDEDLAA
jgi:hypothetical protein